MSPHDTGLRDTLHRLADSAEPLPVADDLWHRAQAARRRGQVVVVAAVLAIIASVTWSAVLLGGDDREARTASQDAPGGAIPSRIDDPGELPLEDATIVGRASLVFVSAAGQPVAVDAVDGSYHALDLAGWDGELLSLSPDGGRLAWTIGSSAEGRPAEGFGLLELDGGDYTQMSSGTDGSLTPEGISWSPSSRWLTWFADSTVSRKDLEPSGVPLTSGMIVEDEIGWSAIADDGVVTYDAGGPRRWQAGRGTRASGADAPAFATDRGDSHAAAVSDPSGDTIALATARPSSAVDFLVADVYEERPLPADLYPEGAESVAPLGWAATSLLLADVEAPPGSYATGRHLALLTSPDRPEAEWTYRIVMRDVPDVAQLSIAVDLVPDLDGTSSQQLTHDFDAPAASSSAAERDISWVIGLGVAAAIALLMALRWLARRGWRRLTS